MGRLLLLVIPASSHRNREAGVIDLATCQSIASSTLFVAGIDPGPILPLP